MLLIRINCLLYPLPRYCALSLDKFRWNSFAKVQARIPTFAKVQRPATTSQQHAFWWVCERGREASMGPLAWCMRVLSLSLPDQPVSTWHLPLPILEKIVLDFLTRHDTTCDNIVYGSRMNKILVLVRFGFEILHYTSDLILWFDTTVPQPIIVLPQLTQKWARQYHA